MRRLIILLIIVLVLTLGILRYFMLHQDESRDHLTLYGNVDVRQVDLGFRVSGRVQNMMFEEGDSVPTGALMGDLDTRPYEDQIRQAQATIESIKYSLQNAEQILTRRKDLIEGGAVSKEDFETALANRDVIVANLRQAEATLGIALTNYEDTKVYAPTDGTILTRIREPGTIVREADPIYTLSITSPVWIRAFVSEPDLGLIYPNMPAEIFTDTPNGTTYKGHIGFISPVAEFTPKTVETTHLRTDLVYRLRIYAENPDKGLKQGMPVTVKLPLKRLSGNHE